MDLFTKSSWLAVTIFFLFVLACMLPTVTVIAIVIVLLGLIPLAQTVFILMDTDTNNK